jgi:hypothetical protein
MSHRRPSEPIAPATLPGEPLDPKIPRDQRPESDEGTDEIVDSETDRTEI